MKKIIIIVAFIIYISTICFAQEAVVSGGNYHENSSGSISWTLGELVSETLRAEDVVLTQGMQQPTLTVTSVEEHPDLDFRITIFPNPTREFVNIKIDADYFENLRYELYNFKGLIIEQKRIDSEVVNVSMHNLDPAVYFLRIIQDNKVLKIFKIVKQ